MGLLSSRGRRSARSLSARHRRVLTVEELEDRCLLSAYTPAQMLHAYGFDQITFASGSIKGDGTGQTIAIVDAYDAPKIDQDLQKFDAKFGISNNVLNNDGTMGYVLTVAYAQGSKPAYNAGWSQESTLDVEWAHAIAPGAHILLVEAASNSLADLFGAVDYARNYAGVSVVSMSWGSGEFFSESTYDVHMTTPGGHNGVSFIASSGDSGGVVSYPAVSPNVLGVGGTSLFLNTDNSWKSETGWSGSGGGVSVYESKPTSPDVAYDADPNTGVFVYWTNASTGVTGSYSFGGTSVGAPQWAALVAIANQGRTYNTDSSQQGSLDGPTQLMPAIYNLSAGDFHDITSGSAGHGRIANKATAGYDLVTGLGTPKAPLVVQQLVTATSNGGIPLLAGPSGGGSSGSNAFSGLRAKTIFVIGALDATETLASDPTVTKVFLTFFISPTNATSGAFIAPPVFLPAFLVAPAGFGSNQRFEPASTPSWMISGSALGPIEAEAEPETDIWDAPVESTALGRDTLRAWFTSDTNAAAPSRLAFAPSAAPQTVVVRETRAIQAPADAVPATETLAGRSNVLIKLLGGVVGALGAISLLGDRFVGRGRPTTAHDQKDVRESA